MKLREYKDSDLADIQRVFAKRRGIGLDPEKNPLQDLSHPMVRTKLVVVDENDKFIGFAYSKVLMECSLVLDAEATDSAGRHEALQLLHDETRQQIKDQGTDAAVCFIAPVPGFEKLLQKYGWEKPPQLIYLTQSY